MGAIADYVSLLVDAGDYAGRNDIAHLFPRFLGMAEAKLNRTLRTADMEVSTTITLDSEGNGELPADFLEARSVVSPNGRSISAWSLTELNRRYGTYSGIIAGYAVVGAAIHARPQSSGTLTMDYYARIPALTPANPTNWLLDKGPDVYLYCLVEEIAIWEKDAAKAGGARSLKDEAIRSLKTSDQSLRWGNGQFTLGMQTP